MSEQLLTKCPHCSTTFRLSQEQLDIAGGAVRCGACYQVFHASEHIVKKAVVEEVVHTPAEESPDPFQEFENTNEQTSSDDPYSTEEWDLEDHPDADLFAENYHEKMEASENELEAFGYGESEPKAEPEKDDEAWAEKLLDDITPTESESESDSDEVPDLIQDNPEEDHTQRSNTNFGSISSSQGAFSDELGSDTQQAESNEDLGDTFTGLDNWGSEDPFAIDEEEEMPRSAGAVDESWAQAMLSELEEEAPSEPNMDNLEIMLDDPETEGDPFSAKDLSNDIPAVKRSKRKSGPPNTRTKAPTDNEASDIAELAKNDAKANKGDDDRLFESEDFFTQLSPEHDIDDIELGEMPELIENSDSSEDVLEDFSNELSDSPTDEATDQQFVSNAMHFGLEEEERPPRSFAKLAGMILLNLTAIAALCGQYVYFQYDELARNEQYRPYFKSICEQVGCKLPMKSDVSQIKGTNLVVRSHALEKNALVVDAIIYNRARFSQPFPVIELRFDDVNGSIIASRRFKPSEYIHNEGIDLNHMPTDTPVHLTLEVVDPGQGAVNYRINFYTMNQGTI